jgi:TolB-like protein
MRLVAALTLVAFVAALPRPAAAAPRVKVAVMDVKSIQGVPEGTAAILSELVATELSRAGFEVISKSDISAMIGFEKQKQVLGCSDDSRCLAEIGGALGVDFMLSGQVGQIGSQYRIALLLVDARRSRVAARSAQFCERNEDALVRAAQERVAELTGAIRADGKGPSALSQGVVPLPPPPAAAKQPPALAAQQAPTAPAPAPERPSAPGPDRRSAWIVYGVAGGCFALSGGAALVARSRYRALEKLRGTDDYQSVYDSRSKSIRVAATAADVLLVGGIAAAGVGTWLWVKAKPPPVTLYPIPVTGGAAMVASGHF